MRIFMPEQAQLLCISLHCSVLLFANCGLRMKRNSIAVSPATLWLSALLKAQRRVIVIMRLVA